MLVEGFPDPSPLLRLFIADEYAFSVFYPHCEVRIGHHKGTWFCAKLRQGNVVDYIEISDCDTFVNTRNEVLKALVRSLQEQHPAKEACDRTRDGLVIEKTLRIWAGTPNSITRISIVQPGRNASVDEFTGEFDLSPDTKRV